MRGSMSIGLEVAGSIEEAVRKVEQNGVQFFGPVARGKAGAFAFFSDPDGTPIYLVELAAGQPESPGAFGVRILNGNPGSLKQIESP